MARMCNALAKNISIHALREEGDSDNCTRKLKSIGFLSTPSARRATYRFLLLLLPE